MLEELKLEYHIKVYFRQDKRSPPELKKVHPLGKSPVITIEAPKLENPLVLAESAAIVEYVTDHFGPQLVPRRYPDGEEALIGAETKEWLRYRVSTISFSVPRGYKVDCFHMDSMRNLTRTASAVCSSLNLNFTLRISGRRFRGMKHQSCSI